MIAVGTNILIHAHRSESKWHEAARNCIANLASSDETWAIPRPCVHGAVATDPRALEPPTPVERALEQISIWLESPSPVLLGQAIGYWEELSSVMLSSGVAGPRVQDARVAALMLHGVKELWSADRAFARFPDLKVRNPLVG